MPPRAVFAGKSHQGRSVLGRLGVSFLAFELSQLPVFGSIAVEAIQRIAAGYQAVARSRAAIAAGTAYEAPVQGSPGKH
ncbi:MAG: hypothetical protein KAT75_07730, partial [Dehalococcoidia bacterium]|nr:hypothetical protein [Dehalococcoidia bacterium]